MTHLKILALGYRRSPTALVIQLGSLLIGTSMLIESSVISFGPKPLTMGFDAGIVLSYYLEGRKAEWWRRHWLRSLTHRLAVQLQRHGIRV